MTKYLFIAFLTLFFACEDRVKKDTETDVSLNGAGAVVVDSAKLTSDACVDPPLDKLAAGTAIMLCDGEIAEGTMEVDPWNVRHGVEVAGTVGQMNVDCRNRISSYYTDGRGDEYSTVDHWLGTTDSVADQNPWASDANYCGTFNTLNPTWERVVTEPVVTGVNSVFKDKISGKIWSRGDNATATSDWTSAFTYCENLNSIPHGGINTWRLPTQFELMTAMTHGLYDLDSDLDNPDASLGQLELFFWSATTYTRSDLATTHAVSMTLDAGNVTSRDKTDTDKSILCVGTAPAAEVPVEE
jgi:hypothetical protein